MLLMGVRRRFGMMFNLRESKCRRANDNIRRRIRRSR